MKKHLLFLSAILLVFAFAQAQGPAGRLQWYQIAKGTQGQIAIVGTDGNGQWVTPVFTKWSDTLTYLATKSELANATGNQSVSGAFNSSTGTVTITKQNGSSFNYGLDGRYIPLAQRAAVNGVATLGADGKVPSSQLPPQQVSDVYVVNSQAAMLALTAKQGDFAIRTDSNITYVLRIAPPSVYGNWALLPQNAGVQTVNGMVGPNVTITTDNVSEGATNKYFSNTLSRGAVSATGDISYNNSTGVFSHTASGVGAGTYNNVTVNANGHVTAGSNVAYLTSANLANYYTKTEMQTSGSSAVHWNNITNKPAGLGAAEVTQRFANVSGNILALTQAPTVNTTVKVFMNGQKLDTIDYAVSSGNVVLGFTPTALDVFFVVYF